MTETSGQRLRRLPGVFQVARHPDGSDLPDGEWLAVVRAPEGLTVIRPALPDDSGERWIALYSGDTAHGLDVPGMLSALLLPLKEAAVPVFVVSTFDADIVLVPQERQVDALRALDAAGHEVDLAG